MKTTLRFPAAAAAMLLVTLGATLVAQPAAAQHRYETVPAILAPQSAIERFVLRHADSFEPGSEVRLRLVGTPGGQAWFEIPGVLRPAPMTEVRPGVYGATYVVRRRDNPGAFEHAVATLQIGGQRVSARAEIRGNRYDRDDRDGRFGRDDRAPQITAMTPADGERVGERRWTRVSARFSDEGSGVDPASVMLRVDGRDVTGSARVDVDDIRYAEDLQPGRHVAELTVRDRAGNASRRAWTFVVVERGRYDGHDDGGRRR